MTTPETIQFIANISFTLSFILALVIGVAQVKASARDRRDRLTLDTLNQFQTREFAELIHYITTVGLPPDRKSMRALPAAEQVNIIQFGQEMESLGLLVAEKFIDIDLVDKTIGSLVTTAWEKYKPLFEGIRVNAPDPFLGEYFEWLAVCIDKRLNENPRQPFHEAHPEGANARG